MYLSVPEQTTAYLRVRFQDKAGKPALPSTVVYRIDCMTTGQPVLPQTAAAPAADLEVVIAANENRILTPSNAAEKRRVTVVATYGSSADQVTAEYDYEVTNLAFVG